MEDNLIDNELNETPNNEIMELIRWWERIRIHYNIVIVLLLVFIFMYEKSVRPFSATINSFDIIVSLIYLFLLNLCYCLGWGVPLLLSHYFKMSPASIPIRYTLLTIGVTFSVLLTLVVFPFLL